MSVVLIPFPATTASSFSGVLCPSLGFSPLCLMAVLGFPPCPFVMSGSFSGFYIPLGGRFGIYCCCWVRGVYSHLCRSHLTDVGDCSVSVETGRVLGNLTFLFPYSSKTLVNSGCREECKGKFMCFVNLKI